jgi:signal transduction histidine kinase
MRMNACAVLRHDLRTQINHITGFGELLIELAEERGRQDLSPAIRNVIAGGRVLMRLVDRSHAVSEGRADGEMLHALGQKLRPVAALIAADVTALERKPIEGIGFDFREYLGNIQRATERLIGLAGQELLGAGPDSSIPPGMNTIHLMTAYG